MSIQIVRNKETVEFNPSIPFAEQVRNCKRIEIDCSKNPFMVDIFLEQFERAIKMGMSFELNIKFKTNHTLDSYRKERQFDILNSHLVLNEAIRHMVSLQQTADQKLSELARMCGKGME
jgi:hypothetical protein